VRRDVALDLTTADQVTEMQVLSEAAFTRRALYYLATRYASRYEPKGRRYEALRPIYSLNLTGFAEFPGEPSGYQRFLLQDQLRPDGLRLPFWQVGFFDYTRRDYREGLAGWAGFLRGEPLPTDAPGYLRRAAEIISYANLNREERTVIDLLEKAEADLEYQLKYAHDAGLTQGRAQGRAEERADLALAAMRLGVPTDDVVTLFGFSREQLQDMLDR